MQYRNRFKQIKNREKKAEAEEKRTETLRPISIDI